jgi:hypothetical protein
MDIPPCQPDERQYAIVSIGIAVPEGVTTSEAMWDYIYQQLTAAGLDVCPVSALNDEGQRIH